jgi:hypothetical protein
VCFIRPIKLSLFSGKSSVVGGANLTWSIRKCITNVPYL